MILHQNLSFKARFFRGQLTVVDRSPDLPPFHDGLPLLVYIHSLSLDHYQIKHMAFEGFDLTVEMESMADPDQPTPQYLVHLLAQSYTSPDMAFSELATRLKNRQQALNDAFINTARSMGWRELARSKPLACNFEGLYLVSIWRTE